MSGTGDTPSSPPHLPSTSSTALPASNSTRNLANLSRLFRQLRPQLVSAEKRSQKSLQVRLQWNYQVDFLGGPRESASALINEIEYVFSIARV